MFVRPQNRSRGRQEWLGPSEGQSQKKRARPTLTEGGVVSLRPNCSLLAPDMRSKAWGSSADEDTCETSSATPRVSFAGLVYTPVPFNSLHACSAALPDRVPELNLPSRLP